MRQAIAISTLCLFALSALAGCGAGGQRTVTAVNTGHARIAVRWPERREGTRLIPVGANSVRVSFLSGDTPVQSILIVRPSGSANLTQRFVDLPRGAFLLRATAHPNADGTGAPQAQAETTTVIIPGQTTTVSLTLASAIASVRFDPEVIDLTAGPVTLTATARNASGEIVLTNQWAWTSSNEASISIAPNGDTAVITPVLSGESDITVTELESGLSFTRRFGVVFLEPPLP